MQYKLIMRTERNYVITKEGQDIWQIEFPYSYKVAFGFKSISFNNDKYILENKGLFFLRKITLFKNSNPVAKFKSRRCLSPQKIWLDRRNFIYENSDYICSLDSESFCKSSDENVIYRWKTDRYDLEWIIMTLALLSLQNNAFLPSSAMP